MDPLPALRDVRCFVAVAQHGGFSTAAAALGLSQPAVSQAITRLETTYGCQLFERSSRRVRLSAAGEALLPYGTGLLAAAAAFAGAADRWQRPTSITLAYPSLLGTFAARVARRVARRTPGIDLVLRPAGRAAAAEAVAAGEATAAILTLPVPTGLTGIPLFTVAVDHLAVPAGDPVAARRSVRLATLSGHRVLLPADRPRGGPWAALAATLPARAQYPVGDAAEDVATGLDLVAARRGVLPVPALVADTVRRPDVRFVPLADPPPPLRYRLVWPADAHQAPLLVLVQSIQHLLQTR